MKPWMVISLAVLVLGCGDPEADGPEDSRVVVDYKRQLGLDFLRCPDMYSDYSICGRTGCACTQSSQDAARCFIEAFDTCTPAHLTHREGLGMEGWLATDYLVVPTRGGCTVVQFYDTTQVADHCHDVTRSTCSRVSAEGSDWGCNVRATGCGDYVEVVSDPKPHCSMDR